MLCKLVFVAMAGCLCAAGFASAADAKAGVEKKDYGKTPDGVYVEIVEIPGHPWFLGCQFHPEFKSTPLAPHPLFAAFIGASNQHRRQRRAAPASQSVAAADSAPRR